MTLEAGFRIGECDVLPLEDRIVGPDGGARLEPKAMAVLMELARNATAVCTREQIVARVWPRGFVTDDVLTRCIAQIRRALGDDPRSPRCVETIPRRGYRLRMEPRTPTDRTPAAMPASRPLESLIVLPFQNLSASGDEFLADGLTELLILRLSALRPLRVISRTTAMHFKGDRATIEAVAARTGVDWVIEGSVLQAGDQVQVVAQLIDARTDAHLWAADYVRDLNELLPLQNEIARRIADAIRLQLGVAQETRPSPPTLSPPAMRDYLRGRHFLTRRTLESLREARRYFLSVTTEAPEFGPAWASLAEAEMMLAHYGDPDRLQLIEQSIRHAERALTLDPDLGIAHSTRGAARFFFECDLDGAAADLERALWLLPSYTLAMITRGNVCAIRRQFAEASAWIEQALLVDPLDIGVNMNVGDNLILQRRFPEAAQALRRALELVPAHRPSKLRLCWALALEGRSEDARRLLNELVSDRDPDAQWHEFAALVAGAARDIAAASSHCRALERLRSDGVVSGWALARAAAAAGQVDAALDALDAAVAERSSSLPFMCVTPAFDALHAEPRFQAHAARLGLPLDPSHPATA